MATKWSMQDTLLGACGCDWGRPCSFDGPPTRHFCESGCVWQIDKGNFGEVPLTGLAWAWVAHSLGPLHEGNVHVAGVGGRDCHSAAAPGARQNRRRQVFMAVASKGLDTKYLPFEVQSDELNSKVRVGDALTMELGPILNPVSGAPEEIYLDKPTGFTSKRLTLGASRVMRVNSDLSYDHSGKYGEFSHFEYSGESN